jgi:hypothetical protein
MDLTPPGDTKIPFFFSSLEVLELPVSRLLDGEVYHRSLKILLNTVIQTWLLPADLL